MAGCQWWLAPQVEVPPAIDEYRIAVHPIVLGGGTTLFPQSGVDATLQLTGTRTLDSGVVNLTYAPADRV